MKRSRMVATTSTVDQTLFVSAVGVNVGAAVVTLFAGAMVAVVVVLPTTRKVGVYLMNPKSIWSSSGTSYT